MERAFRGVWIPANIYLNGEITPTEKFLLAEIESLDVGEGTREDNGYFATFCNCEERSIRRFLAHLRLLEMIEIEYKDGKRIIRRLYKDTVPTTIKDRFVPPTLEEVKAYCEERHNAIDAERFVDYYQASGWIIARGQKVVDWKALLRSWEKKPIKKLKEISQSDVVGYMAEAVENMANKVEDVITIVNESQRQSAMVGYAINDLSEKMDEAIEAMAED